MFRNKKEKIVCTIEARMTSSRLPEKVLLPLGGKPALEHLIERIRRSAYIDDVIVATTVNKQDDTIIDFCNKLGCSYYRGSEMDVLSRVLGAGEAFHGDIITEITGDCPFNDHRYIDHMIELFFSGSYDYARMYDFPAGFGVQVFPLDTLRRVDKLTDDPIDRVHVTYYIYTHPEQFRIAKWSAQGMMRWPEGRVTLDEVSDYELLNLIAEELYPKKQDFSAEDVVLLLKDRPDLVQINAKVRQKDPKEL